MNAAGMIRGLSIALSRARSATGLLLLALLMHSGNAMASFDCGVGALTSTTLTLSPNQITNTPTIAPVGIGCSSITVSLAIDATSAAAGGTVNPTGTGISAGNQQNLNIKARSTEGPMTVTATCTAGCGGSGATSVTFNITVQIDRTITNISPTSVNAAFNQTYAIQAQTLNDGQPVSGVQVDWSVIGPATISRASTITTATGEARVHVTLGADVETITITATRADDPTANIDFFLSPPSKGITVTSGDGQTAEIGTAFGNALAVYAEESNDGYIPLTGAQVNWSVSNGACTLSSATTITDASGSSTVSANAGPTEETCIVSATLDAEPSAIATFQLNVTAPTATTTDKFLTVQAGDNQTAPMASAFATPLSVLAEESVGGAPRSPSGGTQINWQANGACSVAQGTSSANSSGVAVMNVVAAASGTGSCVVTATRADSSVTTASFLLFVNNYQLVTSLPSSGNTSTTPSTGINLSVLAKTNATPDDGETITWIQSAGPAAVVLSPNTSTTDAAGIGSILFTATTPGTYVIEARWNPLSGYIADDRAVAFTVTVAAASKTLAIVSGNGQTGPTRQSLPQALVVEAKDNDAGVGGVNVIWTVTSGDASVQSSSTTTAAGTGRTQNTVTLGAAAGQSVIRATRSDDPSATVDFLVSATQSCSVTAIAGANQVATPGAPLPSPIVVEAQCNGLPQAGVPVEAVVLQGDATITGEGAKLLRTTGADGRVSFTVTVGTTPGPLQIKVSAPGLSGAGVTISANVASLAAIPGLTPEGASTGEALDQACAAIGAIPAAQRTPGQNSLLALCLDLADASRIDPEQTSGAINELLPDASVAMITVALQAGQAQLDNLRARLAALRSGNSGSKFGGLAIASPAGSMPLTGLMEAFLGANGDEGQEVGGDFDRWGFFVSGTLGRGEAEAGALTPKYDFDINGLTAGVDYRFSDRFVLGGSLGYTSQTTEMAGGAGEVDAKGWSLSAYSTYYHDDSWYMDSVLTYGQNTYDIARQISFTLTGTTGTQTYEQRARSSTDGTLLSLAGTFGKDFQRGGWNIGPYGRLIYSRISFDDTIEQLSTGLGNGIGLQIQNGDHTSFASILGAKMSSARSMSWGILMPHFQVEWEREFKDEGVDITARFLNDPSNTTITIDGQQFDNSFFRLGAGLSALVAGGKSGFFYIEHLLGKDGITQTNLGLGLRIEF